MDSPSKVICVLGFAALAMVDDDFGLDFREETGRKRDQSGPPEMGMKALSLIVVSLAVHSTSSKLISYDGNTVFARLRRTVCNVPIPESETCMVGMCGRVPQPAVPVPMFGPMRLFGKPLGNAGGERYPGIQMHMYPLGSLDVPCFFTV